MGGICKYCGKAIETSKSVCGDCSKAIHQCHSKNYYKNYKLNKGNDVYFDTTSFYDNFCKIFREKFCTELGQNKINAKELADKYGISIKTIYSWKYGSMPTLDKLLDLHDIIGDDILPNIKAKGILVRHAPIKSEAKNWVYKMCYDCGYTAEDISKILNITQTMFDARYKNKICKSKSAVELLVLFGYETVKKYFYEQ